MFNKLMNQLFNEDIYRIGYEEEDIEYQTEDYYNYLKELQDVTKDSSNN